jgi:creatinine amidohydrolase
LVNGHGGNAEAVAKANLVLIGEGRRVLTWWPPPVPHGDAHAGSLETSVMLALRADLVQVDRLAPGERTPISEMMNDLRSDGVRSVSTSGVLGDPTTAAAADGAHILTLFVDDLVSEFDGWHKVT